MSTGVLPMTGPADDAAPGGAEGDVGAVGPEAAVRPVNALCPVGAVRPLAAVPEVREAPYGTSGERPPVGRASDEQAPDEQIAQAWDTSDEQFLTDEASDWAWVEEWRDGGEPIPWGPGLALSGFTGALVASAIYVLSAGLADHPIVAIGVNVLVAGGLAPALWLSRSLPVVRWIAGGAAFGVLLAWLSVLLFLV